MKNADAISYLVSQGERAQQLLDSYSEETKELVVESLEDMTIEDFKGKENLKFYARHMGFLSQFTPANADDRSFIISAVNERLDQLLSTDDSATRLSFRYVLRGGRWMYDYPMIFKLHINRMFHDLEGESKERFDDAKTIFVNFHEMYLETENKNEILLEVEFKSRLGNPIDRYQYDGAQGSISEKLERHLSHIERRQSFRTKK